MECIVLVDDGVAFDRSERLADLVEFAAGLEPALQSGAWQMSIRLVDDETISDLHERYFADPSTTDVITFPSGECADVAGAYLGDVAISVETAARQACEAGQATDREIAFLALHGLLHLSGYVDSDDASRDEMLRRQTALLERWESARGEAW